MALIISERLILPVWPEGLPRAMSRAFKVAGNFWLGLLISLACQWVVGAVVAVLIGLLGFDITWSTLIFSGIIALPVVVPATIWTIQRIPARAFGVAAFYPLTAIVTASWGWVSPIIRHVVPL
jgi:hypothetical protein